MRHFQAAELNQYLKKSAPLLLDVREPWEFEICKLEGSQLIPMREIPLRIKELDKERETVVICHHGVRSLQVGYFLESSGFTDVINLSGGVAAWAGEVDSTMATY